MEILHLISVLLITYHFNKHFFLPYVYFMSMYIFCLTTTLFMHPFAPSTSFPPLLLCKNYVTKNVFLHLVSCLTFSYLIYTFVFWRHNGRLILNAYYRGENYIVNTPVLKAS